jgi:hypothetical protein
MIDPDEIDHEAPHDERWPLPACALAIVMALALSWALVAAAVYGVLLLIHETRR